MKSVFVLQHIDSEDLGAMEPWFQHLGVAVQYQRPLVTGKVAKSGVNSDGLILLGGGAWGTTGSETHDRTTLPTLDQELRFTYDHMKRNRPIVAMGLGSQIACIAAGGGSEKSSPAFEVGTASRINSTSFGAFLPESFPYAMFMRDRPVLPDDGIVHAVDEQDRPLVFSIGRDVLCFTCHPGYSAFMLNKVIEEVKGDRREMAPALTGVREFEVTFAENLTGIMSGISDFANWLPETETESV